MVVVVGGGGFVVYVDKLHKSESTDIKFNSGDVLKIRLSPGSDMNVTVIYE